MSDMIKSIKQVFTDTIFYIPDYQRGYAWEDRQCQDLLDDLELLQPAAGKHYTGTLVVCPRKDDQAFTDINQIEYQAFDIIDGQQRLTTISILLKVLHDQMQSLPETLHLAENLRSMYLFTTDRNRQPFSKLKVSPESQEFFESEILGLRTGSAAPTIRSHQRLLEAKAKFQKFFAEKSKQEDYVIWLQSLYGKIINQLKVIFYPVTDELDAGVLFETMNDRGKPLTEMEKVKNHLLYLSAKLEVPDEGHPLNRRINETWKFIYEKLMHAGLSGRANEDQLLRSHWLMAYRHDASLWENARTIKNHFSLKRYQNRHTDLLSDLLAYLDSLKQASKAYCDALAPHLPGAFGHFANQSVREQVILWSKKISRQGVRAAYLPILFGLHIRSKDGGQAYLDTIQRLEKFSFRVFTLNRMRSNAGQSSLYYLGNQYYKNENAKWLLEEIAQLLINYSPHKGFESAFENAKENWYDWGGINYFLYEYEHHLAGGRPVELTWETLSSKPRASSIEHILPQTPTDPAWLERFTPDQRKFWTNHYANLTLTYDNSALGNRKFADKKGAPGQKGTYANSPLFVEKQIAGFDDWNPSTLEKRRDELKAWALERWKVDVQPREKPQGNTIASKIVYADQFGLGDELEAIHKALGRLGMWPTVRKGIQYRSPHNFRASMFVVYIYPNGLGLNFYPENFTTYPAMTMEKARETIGLNPGWNWLTEPEIPALLEGLSRFEQQVKSSA